MKRIFLPAILFFGVFVSILHFGGYFFQDEHPTLNDEAESPDLHLKNVKKYAREGEFDRSLYHLNKAMETMRIIEDDADVSSGEMIENTLMELHNLKYEIETNTLSIEDLNAAIGDALNALTYTELRVSESYAETNKLRKARIAMTYAKVHLKHAMSYAKGRLRHDEHKVYDKIDSMLASESLYSIDATFEIATMVSEIDSLLKHN